MQVVAATQLKNLRAQLEAKLETVMSDRFRTFLDLHVDAPRICIPADHEPDWSDAVADHARAGPGASLDHVLADVLAVDLGSISVTTSRLARVHDNGADDDSVGPAGPHPPAGAAAGGKDDERFPPLSAVDSPTRSGRWSLSSSGAGTVSAGLGSVRDGWHLNFYDVYGVQICRMGVTLEHGWRESGGPAGMVGGVRRSSALLDPFNIKVIRTYALNFPAYVCSDWRGGHLVM